MASPRTSEARDPKFSEILTREAPTWVPMFLARAGLGLSSVVVVSATPDGVGSVALLSAVEASALLRKRGDARGAAKVSGTATPGAVWAVSLGHAEQSVVSLPMAPILSRGA